MPEKQVPVEQLPWETPSELAAGGPDIHWLIEDYLALGNKTLIAARPKAGKSFLAFGMAEALLNGEEHFLGKKVDNDAEVGVLFCTEEASRTTINVKTKRFGLTDQHAFRVLRRVQVYADKWPDIVARISKDVGAFKAEAKVDEVVVVIDGFGKWAGFAEGQENDPGVTRTALTALDQLTGDNIAVFVIHHAGWKADRVRGSTGIAGEADILLFLDGQGKDPRVIQHQGGRLGEACDDLAYRLTDQGLESMGAVPTARRAAKMGAVLTAIEKFEKDDTQPTTKQLADALDVHEATVLRHLRRLEQSHVVERKVTGQAGAQATHWRKLSPIDQLFAAGT